MWEQLDKGNFFCGIFDFQKAFDTVDHNILIQTMNYYGVTATANNWFSSYLENRTQFVSTNGYSSDLYQSCFRASTISYQHKWSTLYNKTLQDQSFCRWY